MMVSVSLSVYFQSKESTPVPHFVSEFVKLFLHGGCDVWFAAIWDAEHFGVASCDFVDEFRTFVHFIDECFWCFVYFFGVVRHAVRADIVSVFGDGFNNGFIVNHLFS